MKLTCLQENLNKGLGIVSRVAATRTTLPITGNLLLATDQGRLKVVATNLEMAITCWTGAKVEEEGEITVPARLLSEFIAVLPNDKIELTVPAKKKSLEIKCARFEARISGVDAKEFPPIPRIEDGITTRVEAGALKQGIGQVIFATASDESRPVLTGVYTELDGERLTLAAADGFRLAVYRLSLLTPVPSKVAAIIPAKTLAEVNRSAADSEETVDITLDPIKGQVLFRMKDLEIFSQLIQGSFPRYEQLIPDKSNTRVVVDTSHFLKAVKTAAIFARDSSGIVRLVVSPGGELSPGKLSISARSEELGDNVSELDGMVQGEEAKIAFNGKYLIDVLSVIKETEVSLEIISPTSPGVIRPVSSDNYVHVIMPMFVQW